MNKKVLFANRNLITNKQKFKNTKIKSSFSKLKKKWRFWRGFKQYFINKKKITYYKKLQWNFNEKRLIWHQLIKSYLLKSKSITKKQNIKKYIFFLRNLELKLPVVLLRSKFYTKLINCSNSIKKNLISVNGIIMNKNVYTLKILDLYQKRRHINIYSKKEKNNIRSKRLKWRRFRWKKAKFLFWKIRRFSNFNLYLNRKINNSINFLEINYKIPAGIVIKQPFFSEFLINQQKNIVNNTTIKKIFFIY